MRRSRQLAFLTMDVLSEPGATGAAAAGRPGRVVFLYSLVPGARMPGCCLSSVAMLHEAQLTPPCRVVHQELQGTSSGVKLRKGPMRWSTPAEHAGRGRCIKEPGMKACPCRLRGAQLCGALRAAGRRAGRRAGARQRGVPCQLIRADLSVQCRNLQPVTGWKRLVKLHAVGAQSAYQRRCMHAMAAAFQGFRHKAVMMDVDGRQGEWC